MTKKLNEERWTKATGLYAFWRYDLFPFVLGGHVEATNVRGHVKLVDYSGGIVEPLRVVPKALGELLQKQLDTLKNKERTAREAFEEEWRSKVVALISPELTREATAAAATRRNDNRFYCEQCRNEATGECPVVGHVSQHIEHKGSGYWGPSKRHPVIREEDGTLTAARSTR